MTKSKKKRITNTVRFIILAIYLLIVLLPIYWMVITSFKTNPEIINAQHITYFPKIFTLENYQSLFNMMDYGIYLKNSLIVTLSSAVVVVILSIFGGYDCYHSYVCGIYQNGTDQQLYVIVYFLFTHKLTVLCNNNAKLL